MSNILYIAANTFRGLLRDKVLYNVWFLSLVLMIVGYWASLLVFGHQDRPMLHFGILISTVSVLGTGISIGARSVFSAIESKSIYLIISRPIPRPLYWIAKFKGLSLFLAFDMLLLLCVLAIAVKTVGGDLHYLPLVQWATLLWVESCIACAFAMALGLFFRPTLSAMIAATYVFIAHTQAQIEVLGTFRGLFPKAEYFLVGTRAYYDLPLELNEWVIHFGYGLVWVFIFILIGNALFYRKNL